MVGQFAEMTLAAKMLVLVGPLFLLISLYFSLRAGEFTWPNIAVIGLGILTLFLPSIHKLSLAKDEVSFEQFERGVTITQDSFNGLQAAAKANSDAISQLTARVDDLTKVTRSIGNVQPAQTSELDRISGETQKIQGIVKSNETTLDAVRKNTDAYKQILIK